MTLDPASCRVIGMTTILTTRTKAPFVIAYVGPKGPSIEGYAYTRAAGIKRARRMGRAHVVLPVEAGKVAIPPRDVTL